jgi:hypothetical protein
MRLLGLAVGDGLVECVRHRFFRLTGPRARLLDLGTPAERPGRAACATRDHPGGRRRRAGAAGLGGRRLLAGSRPRLPRRGPVPARARLRRRPVHPSGGERFGRTCYPTLDAVPADRGIEVVDVFRRSDRAGAHVDEAIALGARAVWLQLGVVDEAAAGRARAAGLRVVMDRCPKIELPRLPRTG